MAKATVTSIVPKKTYAVSAVFARNSSLETFVGQLHDDNIYWIDQMQSIRLAELAGKYQLNEYRRRLVARKLKLLGWPLVA